MNNYYHISKLPKLDTFNKIQISYLNKKLFQKDFIIVNKNLTFNKDFISLITSYFGIQPHIYGQIKYNMLHKELYLNIPFKKESINSNISHILNHNLVESKNYFIDDNETQLQSNKFNCYQKTIINSETFQNKLINYYQENNEKVFDISKEYFNIDKKLVFEWELLPYLKLFIINDINKGNINNNCNIFIEITKLEKKKLIKDNAKLIDETIHNFDKLFNHIYNVVEL